MQYKRWFVWCLCGMMACATLRAHGYALSESCKQAIGRIIQKQFKRYAKVKDEDKINQILKLHPITMKYLNYTSPEFLTYSGDTLKGIAEKFVEVFSGHLQQDVNHFRQNYTQMDSEEFLIKTLNDQLVSDECKKISFYLGESKLNLDYVGKIRVAIYYDWIASDGDFSDTLVLKLQWLLRIYFKEPESVLNTLKTTCKGKNGYAIEAELKTLLKELEKEKVVDHKCPWLNDTDPTECKQCCRQQWVRTIAQAMIAEVVHKKQPKKIVLSGQEIPKRSDDEKSHSNEQKNVKRGNNDCLDIQPHYRWIFKVLCELFLVNTQENHSALYETLLFYKKFDKGFVGQKVAQILKNKSSNGAYPNFCNIIEDWYSTGIQLGYIKENIENQPSDGSVVDCLKNNDKNMKDSKIVSNDIDPQGD